MGQFTAFDQFGLFDLSADPGPAETAYNALLQDIGPDFINTTQDGTNYAEARLYALAMQVGYARITLESARSQLSAATVYDKLPGWEKDYGLTPGPLDTAVTRRAALTARRLLMRGARQEAIETDLSALLGTAFLSLRVTKPSELTVWPSSGSIGNVGSFQLPATTPKFIQLLGPVTQTFVQVTVPYTILNGGAPPIVGDIFTVDPNIDGIAESVGIVATTTSTTASIPSTVTAVFQNAHSTSAYAMTCAPMWRSNQRHVRIIVSASVTKDAESRRKIHEIMVRHEKTVTDWDIIAARSSTTTGPFVIGIGTVGATALGDVAFTF